jgi:hypothetical protein
MIPERVTTSPESRSADVTFGHRARPMLKFYHYWQSPIPLVCQELQPGYIRGFFS